jgi:hypothetical protein
MNYLEKLYRAVILDSELYEEVEADKSLTRQALMTVALVAIIEGIFSLGAQDQGLFLGLSQAIFGSVTRWVIWAFFIAFVGTRILPEPETESNTGELLRTLGFAYAPGVFYVFASLPVIGSIVQLLVPLWQLAAMVIAVRQALDFSSTTRAIGVCVVAFFLMVLTLVLFIMFTSFFIVIASNAIPVETPLIGV